MFTDFLLAPPTFMPRKHEHTVYHSPWKVRRQRYEQNLPVELAPSVYAVRGINHNHPLMREYRSSHQLVGWAFNTPGKQPYAVQSNATVTGSLIWDFQYNFAVNFYDIRPWLRSYFPITSPSDPSEVAIFVRPISLRRSRSGRHPHFILHPGGVVEGTTEDLALYDFGWLFKIAVLRPNKNALPEAELVYPRSSSPEHLMADYKQEVPRSVTGGSL